MRKSLCAREHFSPFQLPCGLLAARPSSVGSDDHRHLLAGRQHVAALPCPLFAVPHGYSGCVACSASFIPHILPLASCGTRLSLYACRRWAAICASHKISQRRPRRGAARASEVRYV